jgi:hypothetical protein
MTTKYEKRISFAAGNDEAIALAEAAEKQKCSKSTIIRQLIYAHLTQKSPEAI